MTQYYTYIIIQKSTGKFYYGSKYAKGSTTNELGTKYFSSSKVVNSLIEKEGIENFEFRVRMTFDCPIKCQRIEQRVIRYYIRKHSDKILNRGAPGAYSNEIGPNKGKTTIHNKTLQKQKMVTNDKIDYYMNQGWELGSLIDYRKTTIVHNPIEKINKRIQLTELESYLSNGWIRGYPKETREKHKENRRQYWDSIPKEKRAPNSKFRKDNPSKTGDKKGSFYYNPITQEQTRTADENKIKKLLELGWVKGLNDKSIESHKNKNLENNNYIVNNPMKNPEIREKMRQTILEQYRNGRVSPNKGKLGIDSPNYGKKRNAETKHKMSKSLSEFHTNNPEFAKQRGENLKYNEERNEKISKSREGTVLIENEDGIRKFIKKAELKKYYSEGWIRVKS